MSTLRKLTVTPLFAAYERELRKLDKDTLFLIESLLTDLGILLNQGLTFEDNFQGEELTATADATPDTEFAVPHTLGRVPTRFIVTDMDEGGTVYRSATAWTDTNIYLKSTTGGSAVKVLVY